MAGPEVWRGMACPEVWRSTLTDSITIDPKHSCYLSLSLQGVLCTTCRCILYVRSGSDVQQILCMRLLIMVGQLYGKPSDQTQSNACIHKT